MTNDNTVTHNYPRNKTQYILIQYHRRCALLRGGGMPVDVHALICLKSEGAVFG